MKNNLKSKSGYLVRNTTRLIKNFKYRGGPSLYFYRRVLEMNKKSSVKNNL